MVERGPESSIEESVEIESEKEQLSTRQRELIEKMQNDILSE